MKVKRFFILSLICLALCFIAISCGKKGPPLPPIKNGNILAPPMDLTFELIRNRVLLKWNHKSGSQKAPSPEGFEVFSAVKGPDDCQGCPFAFKSMGKVSMPDMSFQQTLTPGNRYYFRVQALGSGKIKSQYSKTVLVDLSQADPVN